MRSVSTHAVTDGVRIGFEPNNPSACLEHHGPKPRPFRHICLVFMARIAALQLQFHSIGSAGNVDHLNSPVNIPVINPVGQPPWPPSRHVGTV